MNKGIATKAAEFLSHGEVARFTLEGHGITKGMDMGFDAFVNVVAAKTVADRAVGSMPSGVG